ncbi:MAG: phosphatidate cytidylyltransferase [Clostridiales bacterium]|nr:phosphatidate cytidylyltransferase [Clostridiales bacterium]
MIKRLVSSIVALPILLYVLIHGGMVLKISSFIVIGIALYEYYLSTKILNLFTFIGGIVTTMYLYLFGFEYFELFLTLMMFLFLLTGLFTETMKIDKIGLFQISIFYIIVPIYLLNGISSSDFPVMVWLVFIIAWGSDTFAYFTGRLIGKHKLAPTISPKKTIEGSVGGIIGATLSSMIFYYYFDLRELSSLTVFAGFIIITTVISQLGDLVASKIKRIFNIKDFGKIMPGHGGILDRFDSVLIIIPLVYIFIKFI